MLVENASVTVPGETVTLLSGYAEAHGPINSSGVMVTAATGAILGDNIGLWIGRHYGWRVILRLGRILRQNSDQLDHPRQGFLDRAGLSVFLGRFVACCVSWQGHWLAQLECLTGHS